MSRQPSAKAHLYPVVEASVPFGVLQDRRPEIRRFGRQVWSHIHAGRDVPRDELHRRAAGWAIGDIFRLVRQWTSAGRELNEPQSVAQPRSTSWDCQGAQFRNLRVPDDFDGMAS